jgi:membrane-associated phospholipid phosphatase
MSPAPLSAASPGSANLAISTVTTVDDSWYRDITIFAQHTVWLNQAMAVYTSAAVGALALITLHAWWSARSRSDHAALTAATWTVIGTLVTVVCGLGLKQLFHETRPCSAMDVMTVQSCPGLSDYSFPSDHTTVAAALAIGLWLTNRRLGVVAIGLALLEGFSRVYLGLHYPHDVVAAFILSGVVMLVGWPLTRRPLGRALTPLERTPASS